MKSLVLPDNHFIITSTPYIKESCQAIFDRFNMNAFIYAKIYDNGSVTMLTSEPRYPNLHLSMEGANMAPIPPGLLTKKSVFFYAKENNDKQYQELLYKTRTELNQDNPIYMIDFHQGFFEIYVFASPPEHVDINNIFMNNISVFTAFKHHFKEKTVQLRKKAEQNKLVLAPNHLPNINSKSLNYSTQPCSNFKANHFNFENYSLIAFGQEITIKTKILDCAKYLIKGYSVKEIAVILNLQPSTVQKYLNEVKYMLNCSTTSKLIKLLNELTPQIWG